jgi:hypothetical protein
MKFSPWFLPLGCIALLALSTGCTPGNSTGGDNSAALRSIGSTPDESYDYHPPLSPSYEDPFKGGR